MPAFAPHQRKADAVREFGRGVVERPSFLIAALDGPETGGLYLRRAQCEQVAATLRYLARSLVMPLCIPNLPACLCDVGDSCVRIRQVPEVTALLRQLE